MARFGQRWRLLRGAFLNLQCLGCSTTHAPNAGVAVRRTLPVLPGMILLCAIAPRYFRAGADKVSLGSDAVYAAEEYYKVGKPTGGSSIEQISHVYGRQAVVISIDPKRVYVTSPVEAPQGSTILNAPVPDAQGRTLCWYQATVQGGRAGRDIDAVRVAQACEKLGAGEIMLNCIDADGRKMGYELGLIQAVTNVISIPVIASSGAGAPVHFVDVFKSTKAQAALAAGMFHREEVTIAEVKTAVAVGGLPVRA